MSVPSINPIIPASTQILPTVHASSSTLGSSTDSLMPQNSEHTGTTAARSDSKSSVNQTVGTKVKPAKSEVAVQYENGQRVVKIQDTQGTLIYQMPSKGELQTLTEQADQKHLLGKS